MKKIFMCFLLIGSGTLSYCQYQGSKYLNLKTGIVAYGATKGRINLEETPKPNFQLNIGMGYLFTNSLKGELNLNYRRLSNDIINSHLFALSPSLFYSIFNSERVFIFLGVGGIAGIQTLKSKNHLISFKPDNNLFVYGISAIPRIEYFFTKQLSAMIDYQFEIQFNSLRRINHVLNIGLLYHF